jgi:hypothetical protein
MKEDQWAHRSVGMKCGTCMWWVKKEHFVSIGGQPPAIGAPILGRCRRHAPSHISIGWPCVFNVDWCGDHKLDEEKIK